MEIDCNKSKNAVSHRDSLDHNVEVEPQSLAVSINHITTPNKRNIYYTLSYTSYKWEKSRNIYYALSYTSYK